jgi:TM2 domain-containing membrane protein YozV
MPKNKSVQRAYLYWMLSGFGLLGFHRLYLKKRKTAVVWMFTLGLLGFGALADFIFLKWLVKRYNMIQKLKELQRELLMTEQWKEELVRKQKYEEAAFNRDKERLLMREMAHLRLKLKLARVCERD